MEVSIKDAEGKLAELLNIIDEGCLNPDTERLLEEGMQIGELVKSAGFPSRFADYLKEYIELLPIDVREKYKLN